MGRDRRGASFAELLVATLCGILIVHLGLQALARARAIESELRLRSERLSVLRIGRSVLRRELDAGVTGRDWAVYPPDSLRLRAFRGTARVCPLRSGADLVVVPEGMRAPDPEKDSVLLLGTDGLWTAADLVAVGSPTEVCPSAPGVPVRRWTVHPAPTAPVAYARLFESGSYHLNGGALRYRRGAGGRQPLTPDILATPPSLIDAQGDRVTLELTGAGQPAWTRSARLTRW